MHTEHTPMRRDRFYWFSTFRCSPLLWARARVSSGPGGKTRQKPPTYFVFRKNTLIIRQPPFFRLPPLPLTREDGENYVVCNSIDGFVCVLYT